MFLVTCMNGRIEGKKKNKKVYMSSSCVFLDYLNIFYYLMYGSKFVLALILV